MKLGIDWLFSEKLIFNSKFYLLGQGQHNKSVKISTKIMSRFATYTGKGKIYCRYR